MNIINSFSQISRSRIASSLLNTKLRLVVAITAIALLGAILFKAYYRHFTAKALSSSSQSSGSTQELPDLIETSKLRSTALTEALNRLKGSETVVNFSTVQSICGEFFIEANGFSCSVALQDAYNDFNRYSNILPWDHNLYLGKNDEESNYLNASRISLDDQTFIATDAPTQRAMGRFWNMVWEEDVKVIVNLTETIEGGRFKADHYWIESRSEEKNRSFRLDQNQITLMFQEETFFCSNIEGEVQVINEDEYDRNNTQYIVKRTYNLIKNGIAKTVTHYHYRHWPDFGAPQSDEDKACFLKLVDQVADSSPNDPIVIHCSAGVGRTGTFIAVCHARQEQSRGRTIDRPELMVAETVLRMRAERAGMVQTPIQFNFIISMIGQGSPGVSPYASN